MMLRLQCDWVVKLRQSFDCCEAIVRPVVYLIEVVIAFVSEMLEVCAECLATVVALFFSGEVECGDGEECDVLLARGLREGVPAALKPEAFRFWKSARFDGVGEDDFRVRGALLRSEAQSETDREADGEGDELFFHRGFSFVGG